MITEVAELKKTLTDEPNANYIALYRQGVQVIGMTNRKKNTTKGSTSRPIIDVVCDHLSSKLTKKGQYEIRFRYHNTAKESTSIFFQKDEGTDADGNAASIKNYSEESLKQMGPANTVIELVRLETENKFLKERVEDLRHENEMLRSQLTEAQDEADTLADEADGDPSKTLAKWLPMLTPIVQPLAEGIGEWVKAMAASKGQPAKPSTQAAGGPKQARRAPEVSDKPNTPAEPVKQRQARTFVPRHVVQAAQQQQMDDQGQGPDEDEDFADEDEYFDDDEIVNDDDDV